MGGMSVETAALLVAILAGWATTIGVIIASHGRLGARIDALDAKIDERYDRLSARIDALDAKIDDRFDRLSARVDTVVERLARLEAERR